MLLASDYFAVPAAPPYLAEYDCSDLNKYSLLFLPSPFPIHSLHTVLHRINDTKTFRIRVCGPPRMYPLSYLNSFSSLADFLTGYSPLATNPISWWLRSSYFGDRFNPGREMDISPNQQLATWLCSARLRSFHSNHSSLSISHSLDGCGPNYSQGECDPCHACEEQRVI